MTKKPDFANVRASQTADGTDAPVDCYIPLTTEARSTATPPEASDLREVMTARATLPTTAVMDQARSYLAKVIPWPENGEAYGNLHWSEVKSGIDRPIWSGRASRTLDELMGALTWIRAQPGKRDIYVCMSSQRTAEEKTSKKGYKYLAPIRGQRNVVALKSLFMDLDAKGGADSYATLAETLTAFGDFIKAIGTAETQRHRQIGWRLPRLLDV